MPEVKRGFNSRFNPYEDRKPSVEKTLGFLYSKPLVKAELENFKDKNDFLESFLYYSRDTRYYLDNFCFNFFGALDSDFDLFKNLLSDYIRSRIKEDNFLSLVDVLYKCFIKTVNWKNEKSLLYFIKNDPGLYVIYNNNTYVSYIGETNNLERRFLEHKTALLEGTHTNKNLRYSISPNEIDKLSFFVVNYGLDYLDVEKRREQEVILMNNWPGDIYNIKDVNHLYRKKFHKSSC